MYWTVLRCIDRKNRTMTFPDKQVRCMTVNDVELITGIESGRIPVLDHLTASNRLDTVWAVQDILGLKNTANGSIEVEQLVDVIDKIDPRTKNKKSIDKANVAYTRLCVPPWLLQSTRDQPC